VCAVSVNAAFASFGGRACTRWLASIWKGCVSAVASVPW
jgi:hypothetical protein